MNRIFKRKANSNPNWIDTIEIIGEFPTEITLDFDPISDINGNNIKSSYRGSLLLDKNMEIFSSEFLYAHYDETPR